MLDVMTQIVYTIGRYEGSTVTMLGTGFLVCSGKYIITARHVVGDANNGLCFIMPSMYRFDDYQDTTINACKYVPIHIKYSDPFRDLVALEITLPNFISSAPTPTLGSTDDINVGDEVFIIGFPHCVEGRRVLTMQNAMIGAKILVNSSGIKSKYCVINTQTRPGQSGSIVYSKTRNKIIAVLIGAFVSSCGISLGGINPRELHQTTQCISAEYISKMIGE